MSSAPVTAWSPPASGFDQLMKLWMLPVQISVDVMKSSSAMLLAAFPRAAEAVEQTGETAQQVVEAAEEEIANIDARSGDTIPTPAALVS